MADLPLNVLILGGYGMFGRRLTSNLVRHHDVDVTIAGRSLAKARALQDEIATRWHKQIGIARIDIFSDDLSSCFGALGVDCVVNASGPFQGQDYSVAEACIDAGAHYVDLADDREFVAGIDALDERAIAKSLVVTAGASSVPALSSAVVDHYRPEFYALDSIRVGISPGNQVKRGISTVESVLSCVGKPFATQMDGRTRTLHGWQSLRRFDFGPPVGRRWMTDWNGPDLELFPARYPEVRSIRFQAGLELGVLHVGLWALSGLTRAGWVENWAPYARPLKWISERFSRFGSDVGGMFVTLDGIDRDERPLQITWELIADHNTGPDIPTIAAEILIGKLNAGIIVRRGARPCMGMFRLPEFMQVVSRSGIFQNERRSHDQAATQV
ncbi:MAG: saccharopine dehydrogenase NADP-binding domain-containing protein, partial [Gammaproteobacteria bacterium]